MPKVILITGLTREGYPVQAKISASSLRRDLAIVRGQGVSITSTQTIK